MQLHLLFCHLLVTALRKCLKKSICKINFGEFGASFDDRLLALLSKFCDQRVHFFLFNDNTQITVSSDQKMAQTDGIPAKNDTKS